MHLAILEDKILEHLVFKTFIFAFCEYNIPSELQIQCVGTQNIQQLIKNETIIYVYNVARSKSAPETRRTMLCESVLFNAKKLKQFSKSTNS
jgi:hypothetical protein